MLRGDFLLNYFVKEMDENGYTHSVDNLVIVYEINPVYQKSYLDMLIDSIHNLRDSYNGLINYWERLNVSACSKYSWYCNHIHLDDGIYISLGHYQEGVKEKGLYVIFPLLKLEVNPNKHFDKPVFKDLQNIINRFCLSGSLKKYDYAIDIPCKLNDIQVFNTRKEPGLYKGTRYFGQRNKDGYVKIYDKTKESGLDSPLTRVEHTFDMVKHTKGKSFTNFHILQSSQDEKQEDSDLSKNDKLIIGLCMRLSANNLEFEDLLTGLDKRKKRKIYNNLFGNFKEISFNQELHDKLLNQVMDKFNVVPDVQEENPESTSGEEFATLPEDYKSPWDE